MPTLVSPGVSVTTTDESFYAPAGAGTVPLIVIATAQDKTAPDGTAIAPYTTAATANKMYIIPSQRELLQNFGNPIFKTTSGTAAHGHELNEYGLMAAYTFLGISNRVNILRADVDLDALEPSTTEPGGGVPDTGTFWVDTDQTEWGMKRRSGSGTWEPVAVRDVPASQQTNGVPNSSFGVGGQVAVIYIETADGNEINFFQKRGGAWAKLSRSNTPTIIDSTDGSYERDFQFAPHTNLPNTRSDGNTASQTGDLLLQTTRPNNGTNLIINRFNGSQWVQQNVSILENSGAVRATLPAYPFTLNDYVWADYDLDDDEGRIILKTWRGDDRDLQYTGSEVTTMLDNSKRHANAAFSIQVLSGVAANDSAVNVVIPTTPGGSFDLAFVALRILEAISEADDSSSIKTLDVMLENNRITFTSLQKYDVVLAENSSASTFILADIGLTARTISAWEPIYDSTDRGTRLEFQDEAPAGAIPDGTLWYDPDLSFDNIDLLINVMDANTAVWSNFRTEGAGNSRNDYTVFSQASEPTGSLVSDGDVWVDLSDVENIRISRRVSGEWVMIDLTDQSSSDGMLFADARAERVEGGAGNDATEAMLDADAPDAELYPTGMLLWNTRASGGNVKKWVQNHEHEGVSIGGRWVNESGNRNDGSPYLLRQAQRRVVVRSLQAAVLNNSDIRDETTRFNLIAVPGYPELSDEMVGLSTDRKETAFCVIDPPFRLNAGATEVRNWLLNRANAAENGEQGLLTRSNLMAVYYPHGLATGLDGRNVMVPASHMVLRTYAYNDQVSFPWFAPAGTARGLVNNATSVGYLDALENEYVPVSLNEGQRDVYYLNSMNPIANFPGRGIMVFGQRTLSPVASALDRVNVSRLLVYIRERLDDIVRPFLFEPNDSVTQTNAKSVVDRFLSELITQRGLYDFSTVCDASNNTPARIDRNELHIDIAIQPVKAVEFIYIPIRIQNTLGSTA